MQTFSSYDRSVQCTNNYHSFKEHFNILFAFLLRVRWKKHEMLKVNPGNYEVIKCRYSPEGSGSIHTAESKAACIERRRAPHRWHTEKVPHRGWWTVWPGLCPNQTPGRQKNIECEERNAPPVSLIWLKVRENIKDRHSLIFCHLLKLCSKSKTLLIDWWFIDLFTDLRTFISLLYNMGVLYYPTIFFLKFRRQSCTFHSTASTLQQT